MTIFILKNEEKNMRNIAFRPSGKIMYCLKIWKDKTNSQVLNSVKWKNLNIFRCFYQSWIKNVILVKR